MRVWRFILRSAWRLIRLLIVLLFYFDHDLYMRWYIWFLRRRGAVIHGRPRFISPRSWFDGTDYSLFEIGNDAVISSYVRLLTHDYAPSRAFKAIGMELDTDVASVRPIRIGENCFIGTNSILMPGTVIGKNVIVGAGSVVRGTVADNSMIMGNPAEVVGNTLEWAHERMHLLEEGKLRPDPAWWRRKDTAHTPEGGAATSRQGG